VNRNDVTKEQAAAIGKALFRTTGYLSRLRRRMVQVGFPPDDPLFRLVERAFDVLQHLGVEVHYLSCGVGEPGRDGHGPPPTLGR
jgi:hypothetical protein